MSISLSQAHEIASRYAEDTPARWFSDEVVDRGSFWFFAVGFVGSRGVIIDKEDGRVTVVGSSPSVSLDDWFWAHEAGLSGDRVVIEIVSVASMPEAMTVLFDLVSEGPPRRRDPWPRRAWLTERLALLPARFEVQGVWLAFPYLRSHQSGHPFTWRAVRDGAPAQAGC
jgi:hypothetical protein